MRRSILTLAVLAAAMPLLGQAQTKPEDVITYRQSLMQVIRWNFGPLGAMAKGDMAFDADIAARNASLIHQLSLRMEEGFAEGSGEGDTDAKAEIWSDWEDFLSKVQGLQETSGALAEVAAGGDYDAFRAQFAETGKACKACHDDYREK